MTTLPPWLCQHARRAFTQARCAAGHDEYLAFDFHVRSPVNDVDVNVNYYRYRSRKNARSVPGIC